MTGPAWTPSIILRRGSQQPMARAVNTVEGAVSLVRAVREVKTASNDFCGADLRQTTLESTLLEGVRWDAETTWPEKWEECIRRASLLTGEDGGVLIVGAEPHDSAVGVDA